VADSPKPEPKKPECSFCKKVRDLLLGGLSFVVK
jgi:hypothetical protein